MTKKEVIDSLQKRLHLNKISSQRAPTIENYDLIIENKYKAKIYQIKTAKDIGQREDVFDILILVDEGGRHYFSAIGKPIEKSNKKLFTLFSTVPSVFKDNTPAPKRPLLYV